MHIPPVRVDFFIKTENPLPQGEEFLLNLQLPGLSGTMKIDCQVAEIKDQAGVSDKGPSGMVVKFSGITEKDDQVLKEYIRKITG